MGRRPSLLSTGRPTTPTPRPRDNASLGRSSWIALIAAVLVLGLSAVAFDYRVSLPTDGWSFARDLTGTGERLVFYQQFAASPSPLHPGDVLVAIDNQSLDDIRTRALTLRPSRPAGWVIGGSVDYTVLRDGRNETFSVTLLRRSLAEVWDTAKRSWLEDPALFPVLLIGFLVFSRRSRTRAAQLLLLLSATYVSSNGISQAVTNSNVVGPSELFDPIAFVSSEFFNSWIWPIVIAPIYLHLFLGFPVAKAPLRRHPRLTLAVLYGGMAAATLVALVANPDHPLAFWRTWSILSTADYFGVLTISIVIVIHTLRTVRDPIARSQVRWVASGFFVTSFSALAGGVLLAVFPAGVSPIVDLALFRLPFLAFPASLAIAIMRNRLFDFDIIINRTLIGGALLAILGPTFLGSLYLFQSALGSKTGIAIAGSTLLIAVLFQPARQRVQSAIDRRFYRQRIDADQVLAAFATTTRDVMNLKQLTDGLLEVVEQTMHPKNSFVWLGQPVDRVGPVALNGAIDRPARLPRLDSSEARESADPGPSIAMPRHEETLISGRSLLIARVIWAAILIWLLGTLTVAVAARIRQLSTMANQPGSAVLQLGMSPEVYIAIEIALEVTVVIAFTLTALLIAWRRSHDWFALSVSVAFVAYIVWIAPPLDALAVRDHAWKLSSQLAQALGMWAATTFFFLFPDGRFVPRWTRFLPALSAVDITIGTIFPESPFNIVDPFAVSYLGFAIRMAWWFVGLFAQLYRLFRVAGPIQRQQTKLIVLALVVGVTFYALCYLPRVYFSLAGDSGATDQLYRLLAPTVFLIGLLIIPVLASFSMLRYHLWDVDVILNRGLVYGGLTVALVIVYVTSVFLLQRLLGSIGDQDTDLAVFGATVAIVGLFSPARRFLQDGIERVFFRRRYDAKRILEGFGATLHDHVDVNRLSDQLVAVMDEMVHPGTVSLWLHPAVQQSLEAQDPGR